jgi:hypothetical protein
MSRRRNPWIALGFDSWALGLEASTVIGLRALKLAAGGFVGAVESERMVREKVEAVARLQTMALAGDLGLSPLGAARKAVTHYRRKVRANRRRLAKG